MFIRISPDARLTRRKAVALLTLTAVAFGLWLLQQTPYAPLPHDGDTRLLGVACGLAFGLVLFCLADRLRASGD